MLRLSLIFLYLLSAATFRTQSTVYGTGVPEWGRYDLDSLQKQAMAFDKEDLVVLAERVTIKFAQGGDSRIQKNVVIRINNAKGAARLSSVHLPESFDFYDRTHFEQGTYKFQTPYVSDYRVNCFAGRFVLPGSRRPLGLASFQQTFKRTRQGGEHFNDDAWRFELQDVHAGDVIELYYDCSFKGDYRDNLFYFHSDIAKLHCEYNVGYSFNNRFRASEFTMAVHIPDSLVSTDTRMTVAPEVYQTKTVVLRNLQRISHPKNSFEGENLPHLYVDLGAYTIYKDGEWIRFKPQKFQWVMFPDTVNDFQKAYTSHYTGVRKFANQLPDCQTDSSRSLFLTALCDSFNNCRYISSSQLFYKESQLYNLYGGDHLLKRRIVQHQVFDLVRDIMNERKLFYYKVNVLDGRFARHSPEYRIHNKYRSVLYAVPVNEKMVYLMPRYFGVKYYVNELPFYFEDTRAALTGENFQGDTREKSGKAFRMLQTPASNQNINLRTENAVVRVDRVGRKAEVTGKLSLSGQFSTLLRHLYSNDCIDSTVQAYYFRKCTDKPGASEIKVRNTSSSHVYPFRQTFTTSVSVKISDPNVLELQQWFSFPVPTGNLWERPTHDYYFDFLFTDSYSFLLQFDEATAVLNASAFVQKLSNDYFSLDSEISQNEDKSYLVRVRLSVKQRKVPLADARLLDELVSALDRLNHFSLQLSKKT